MAYDYADWIAESLKAPEKFEQNSEFLKDVKQDIRMERWYIIDRIIKGDAQAVEELKYQR